MSKEMGAYVDVSAEVDDPTGELMAAAKKHLIAMHAAHADGSLTFYQSEPFTDMYTGHRLVRLGVTYQAKQNP